LFFFLCKRGKRGGSLSERGHSLSFQVEIERRERKKEGPFPLSCRGKGGEISRGGVSSFICCMKGKREKKRGEFPSFLLF